MSLGESRHLSGARARSCSVIRAASGSTSGEVRQIPGHPINEQWYRPYTYNDANGDGDPAGRAKYKSTPASCRFGYRVPRDIFSVQNGFDLFGRRLRINAMFDYKGGSSILGRRQQLPVQHRADRLPRHAGSDSAARSPGGGDCQDVRHGCSTARATRASAGYFQNSQFWKFREFVGNPAAAEMRHVAHARAAGSTLVFGARNLHTWSSWTGIDPEANYGLDAVGSAERVPDHGSADVLHAPSQPQVLTLTRTQT